MSPRGQVSIKRMRYSREPSNSREYRILFQRVRVPACDSGKVAKAAVEWKQDGNGVATLTSYYHNLCTILHSIKQIWHSLWREQYVNMAINIQRKYKRGYSRLAHWITSNKPSQRQILESYNFCIIFTCPANISNDAYHTYRNILPLIPRRKIWRTNRHI